MTTFMTSDRHGRLYVAGKARAVLLQLCELAVEVVDRNSDFRLRQDH